MDSEGTVSRITLMHPDAKNVSDNMRQGESYFVTNVTQKEVSSSGRTDLQHGIYWLAGKHGVPSNEK